MYSFYPYSKLYFIEKPAIAFKTISIADRSKILKVRKFTCFDLSGSFSAPAQVSVMLKNVTDSSSAFTRYFLIGSFTSYTNY